LLFEQTGTLKHHAALRRERGGQQFVGFVEGPFAIFVEHLHHADQRIIQAGQRNGQQAAGVITGLAVDLLVEARVGVAVGHVDNGSALGTFPSNAGLGGEANLFRAGCDGRIQLVGRLVVEKNRAAVGAKHLARCFDDLFK